jgi:tetratricopeptide (TPR) repeat protein
MEIRIALPLVAALLGSAYLWSGRAADAVPLLEEGVEALTAMRILGLRSCFITFLAEAYLVLGRVAEAREQAEQAVSLARAQQAGGWEAWGLKLLGDTHAHEPAEAEQAGDAYRQALALATELGMRPLIAHCHFGLGKLHAKTGLREKAREHLATVTTLYREMGMQFWLEQAEMEMRGLA